MLKDCLSFAFLIFFTLRHNLVNGKSRYVVLSDRYSLVIQGACGICFIAIGWEPSTLDSAVFHPMMAVLLSCRH